MPDLLHLNGLRIRLVDDSPQADDAAVEAGADIVWQRCVVPALPPHVPPLVLARPSPEGEWTHHFYGPPGASACEFAVSPDGRRIVSRSLATVSWPNLFALFAEPVMRTIFHRLGLVSFHGAALRRGDAGILLLGGKGAGKSTTSAMLIGQGWALLSDDLCRVRPSDRGWMLVPGNRQLKLRPDALAPLGLDGAALDRRWEGPEAPDDAEANKFVLEPPGEALSDVPLAAIHVLGPRTPGAARMERLAPFDRLRALIENLTEVPLDPAAPPQRAAFDAAGDIARTVAVLRLSLPDEIGRAAVALAALPLESPGQEV